MMVRTIAVLGIPIVVAAAAVFYVAHQVSALESDLRAIDAAIDQEREAIRVLEADWAYLNRPERLRRLSETHLDLSPTPPERLARIDDVPMPAPEETAVAGIPMPVRKPNRVPGIGVGVERERQQRLSIEAVRLVTVEAPQ